MTLKVEERVNVKSQFIKGTGKIIDISNNSYYPVQVEMDQADEDGHKVFRFMHEEVEKLEETETPVSEVEGAYDAAPYEAKLSIDGDLETEDKDLNEVDMAFLVKNVKWTIEKLKMDIEEAEDPEE